MKEVGHSWPFLHHCAYSVPLRLLMIIISMVIVYHSTESWNFCSMKEVGHSWAFFHHCVDYVPLRLLMIISKVIVYHNTESWNFSSMY